jgi:hypothetical protein
MRLSVVMTNERFVRQLKALGLRDALFETFCNVLQSAGYTIYETRSERLEIRRYRIGGPMLPFGGIDFVAAIYKSPDNSQENLQVLIPLRVTSGAVDSQPIDFNAEELRDLELCACEATELVQKTLI